jgi:cytochrome c2
MQDFARSGAAVLFVAAMACATVACDPHRPDYAAEVRRMTGGDPKTGRDKIRQYGCNGCHTIPGIVGANTWVGPPLTHWARRAYIAGELPNTPENLSKWIQHPPQFEPKTAMPEMGVNEQDSRDMAAYLYMLR